MGVADTAGAGRSGSTFSSAVHQAEGMASVQAERSVLDARALLIDFARRTGRRLDDVAAGVVARRLRFDPRGQAHDLTEADAHSTV